MQNVIQQMRLKFELISPILLSVLITITLLFVITNSWSLILQQRSLPALILNLNNLALSVKANGSKHTKQFSHF